MPEIPSYFTPEAPTPDYFTPEPTVPREPSQGQAKPDGIFSRLKSFDRDVLSDINLGSKIGSGLLKGLVGNTAKTVVQMPQSFATGALGLADAAGIEGAGELREKIAKPINAPILGEVKPLSAVPTDTEAATPKEALGQAIGMLPEAALFGAFTMPGAGNIPKTSLGKLAQSFGIGAEYGALGGGSRALQNDLPMDEVLGEAVQSALMSGGISMGLSAASMIPSGELARVPKDIGNLARRGKEYAVEKIKAIMPYTTNIKKADIKLMTNPDIAPRIQERLDVMREGTQTGRIQEAEDQLKQLNYDKYKAVYRKAKEAAGAKYEAERKAIDSSFGAVTGDGKALQDTAKEKITKFHGKIDKGAVRIPGDSDGSDILTDMYSKVQSAGKKPTVSDLFDLKKYLWESHSGLEQGTPAYAASSAILDSVDDQINALTKGASQTLNADYRAFKLAESNVAPLWKNNVKWDTQLNFVKSLESASKTGSRKALAELEKLAGLKGFVENELQASRLARLLSMEKGITGPRQLDDTVSRTIMGVPAMIGATFGPLGAGAGFLVGAQAAKTLQSPAWWSEVLYRSFKDKGIDITADQVTNLVNSPLVQQLIQSVVQGDGKDTSKQDSYAE